MRFCVNCFTAFEMRVLYAMFNDATVKGMTAQLGVTMRTVKFYRAKLISKFKVDCFDNLLVYLLKLDVRSVVHAVAGEHKESRRDRRVFQSDRARYFARYRAKNREDISARVRRWYADNQDVQRQLARDNARRRYWLKKRQQGLGNGR